MCGVLKVSLSGYYKSIKPASKKDDEEWREIVSEIKSGYKLSYGYRKVTHEAQQAFGLRVNHKKIYRIMVKYGLLSKIRRKKSSNYRHYDEGLLNIYENKLGRRFAQTEPNTVWLQDITELKLRDGVLYIAAILDTHRSRLVSYKCSTNNNVDLIMCALKDALKESRVKMLHSDRGFQYTGLAYRNIAEENGIELSMSRAAEPKDNAPIESFFSVLKTECIYRLKPKTVSEATALVADFAEYYNNERVILKYDGAPNLVSTLG